MAMLDHMSWKNRVCIEFKQKHLVKIEYIWMSQQISEEKFLTSFITGFI